MKLLLAFPVFVQRPAGGAFAGDTTAMDWFVLATLGFLFFLLGCFATWAWLLWRRSHRPEPHVRLMMELEEERTKPEPKSAPPQPAEPWERPADWWKK